LKVGEEGRVREKQRWPKPWKKKEPRPLLEPAVAIAVTHTPFQEENQTKPACMQTLLSVDWVESWEKRETQKHERRKSLESRLKQAEEERKKTKRREEEENKRREEGKTAKTFLKAT
jgi:hypothetical protein